MTSKLYNTFSPETLLGSIMLIVIFIVMTCLGGGVIWGLVWNLQILSFLPLISVRLPSNILRLFTVFAFFNLEIRGLQDLLLQDTFGMEMDPKPFTTRFAEYRFSSSKFFENVPFILALLMLLLLFFPFLLILNKGLGSTC